MKLVINRSEWDRGNENSYLLSPVSYMKCCLGFYGLAKGFTEKQLCDVRTPHGLCVFKEVPEKEVIAKYGKELFNGKITKLCGSMMEINDRKDEPDREEKIFNMFAEIEVEVIFVD